MDWNYWWPERGYIPVPTVFGAARAVGLRTVMVVGKDKLLHLNAPNTVDTFVLAPYGDDDVVDKAVAEARRGFDLMLVHLPLVDQAGHESGWMSEKYLQRVGATDATLGRLLASLAPQTTVVVTADHGGEGHVHWNNLPEDFRIPWIIAGPGIRRGHAIDSPIATVDTAATIARILSLPFPRDATGRPVDEAFE